MRKNPLLVIAAIVSFVLSGRVYAQVSATGLVTEQETLHNGVLAIQLDCYGAGNFLESDGSEDYAGVSLGISSVDGCKIGSPTGANYALNTDAGYSVHQQLFEPVTESGTWNYYASFWLWFNPCDPDVENCVASDGNTYSYEDPWGYTAYAGDPAQCPFNQWFSGGGPTQTCYGQYDETSYLTDDINLEYAYAGNSSTSTGTFYVDAVAVGISPISDTLYGGDSVTFTAETSNTAGYLPIYQWTQLSGPTNQSGDNGAGSTYIYTAPTSITTSDTATIKGCVTNLTTTPVCQTVSVDVIAVSITVNPPSPNVLLADTTSTAALSANVSNAPDDAAVTWSATITNNSGSAGTITTDGTTTTAATYTAPAASTTLFPASGMSNTAGVTITASVGSPAVTAQTSLTLVEPVTITGIAPTTWSAGSSGVPITITGTGFSANSQVTVTNPNNWTTISLPCTPTANPVTIQCTLSVGANLSNVGASQPVSVTVTTTTAGLTSQATSGPITVASIIYTYAITLTPSTSSLTYGSSSTITPHVTCKIATGAACATNVDNPQTANFSITSGPGTLSNKTNAASTAFTDNVLIPYPSENAVVQGCVTVPVPAPVCGTQSFSIPATTISLSPSSITTGPLGSGKTQPFSVNITNEGTANSLTWTLSPSPSSAAPGTLTSATSTITQQGSPASGVSSNTYTTPNPITAGAAVTMNVCMTANTNICATPVVLDLAGFSLTATNNNPSQTALSLGHSMTYTINATALDGFSGTVTLGISGLPAGVTASFSAPSITTSSSGSVTLTLTSAYKNTTYIGNSTITVTGTSGTETQSPAFTLTTRPLQYKGTCGVT